MRAANPTLDNQPPPGHARPARRTPGDADHEVPRTRMSSPRTCSSVTPGTCRKSAIMKPEQRPGSSTSERRMRPSSLEPLPTLTDAFDRQPPRAAARLQQHPPPALVAADRGRRRRRERDRLPRSSEPVEHRLDVRPRRNDGRSWVALRLVVHHVGVAGRIQRLLLPVRRSGRQTRTSRAPPSGEQAR